MQSEYQKLCWAVCLPIEIREVRPLLTGECQWGLKNSTNKGGVLPWFVLGPVVPLQEIFVQS
jgi:hypothetical protein